MRSEGFAFFRWRVLCNPHIGGDADWWAFYRWYDWGVWLAQNADSSLGE